MIDFENGSVFKLRRNVQGVTGKKEGFHYSALLQNTVVLNRNLWRSGY